jgi:hypothetical protein
LKNVIILAVVAAVGYFLYSKFVAAPSNTATEGYSLATVAERPIPKAAFFALWTQQARKACPDARGKYNLSPAECEDKITQKSAECTSELSPSAPAEVGSPDVARRLGKQYLECVTPYYFCNGVEVKNEEEARQRCQ